MNQELSRNARIILMLTAPLTAGGSETPAELLSLEEYNRLARLLHDRQKQPSDLIGPEADSLLADCGPAFGSARLEALLGRGFVLSQAVEYWAARAIWVVSRADSAYPRRLRSRLKGEAPPVLYGCGSLTLLETGGPAVFVLAGGLEAAALARVNRRPIMEQRLVLVSPVDPQARPDSLSAIERDKIVWGLAEADEMAREGTQPRPPEPVKTNPTPPSGPSPAERLLTGVRKILTRELEEPRTDDEVANLLAITHDQADAWLRVLVDEGALEVLSDPFRYRVARHDR